MLGLIGSGKTPAQIAEELHVSVKTVSTYRARLRHKLELENSAQLTRYAVEQKLAERV